MKTYQEARGSIITDYIEDKLQPFDDKFCFCGNLNGRRAGWRWRGTDDYSIVELLQMEKALLYNIRKYTFGDEEKEVTKFGQVSPIWMTLLGIVEKEVGITALWTKHHPNYENALFIGMSAALDVLKEIHRGRGEDVEEEQTKFIKRQLKPA